jgi:hypothetical protein
VLRPSSRNNLTASSVKFTQVNLAAWESIQREYTARESDRPHGHISTCEPDDVIRKIFKNFSSLSLFAMGPMHHKKIRKLNKLMSDYGVAFLAGCETQMARHFIINENDRF